MAQCIKCKGKLIGREANEYYEALEFDGFTKPICDECFDMMEDSQNPANFDYEQFSDADNGL